MRTAYRLAVLGAMLLLPCASPAATKPRAKAKGSVSSISTKKTVGRSTGNPRAVAARSRNGHLAGTRLVRTKSGRLSRVVVHTPPAPTFQTHPDPDRYTEIQKALADRGYFQGESNGQWGNDSIDALRRFQAGSNLPDDGKISAPTLTGLGLGPRHDGSTASTVPMPPTAAAPSIIGTTVGPAASTAIPLSPP